MKIKELFEMNFEQEIEAVIKVGEYSEKSATEEINNYIVTDQIAKRIDKFLDYYDGQKKDTGIWLSGFYGSGKSYLAKIIGYLLSNPTLMGVEARELFKSRLSGLNDRAFIETKIEGLTKYKTKTVVFDVSGESLTGTFYKKLLLNFIKSIGLPKNHIGYIEYQLMKTNAYDEFLDIANQISQEKIGTNWQEARSNKMYAPVIIEEAWAKLNQEIDVADSIDRIHDFIDTIDADQLVDELDAFLDMDNDYGRIMFIIDEVSEAIDKDHIELTELRGTAQHLSSDEESRYWFIATAQEKLDNVLSKKNINQNDLNIITNRFQHKIHLSSAQVDKVIKERVLAKTDEGKEKLRDFYEKNNGTINSLANLSGKFSTSIESEDEFIDYYPFFNYQMRLLKSFLYSIFQQAQSGGSERGMLVTVDRLLKNEPIFEEDIGKFVTGYQLCDYGFPMPQSELEEKFKKAKTDLKDEGQNVDGEKLLKTIYFLEKSDDLKRTTSNITKSYNDELRYIGEIKEDFNESLELLEEKNYLLKENEEYKITSDVEKSLLEEMNQRTVDWENRVKIVRDKISKLSFITRFSTNTVDNKTYNIAIRDEKNNLISGKSGEVQLFIHNILSIDDDIERELNYFKNDSLDKKNIAFLIPDIKHKDQIGKLTRKIYRYEVMISQYQNTTDEEKKNVIDSFKTINSHLEGDLERLIEESYNNSWLIYDFSEKKLDENSINRAIDEVETKMIDKTFSKRLRESLSQGVAEKFLTVDSEKLVKYCTSGQFNFFDSDGSFIGDQLKVVKEIDEECRSKDGRNGSGLIDVFSSAPYGWETEDIMGTLSALMRSGNLKVKYEGNEYRSYKVNRVHKVFTNSNEFKKAKFYTNISGGPSPAKKQKIVENLLEIDEDKIIDVDFNQNDFEVVNSINYLASQYISKFSKLRKKIESELIDDNRKDIYLLKDFAGRKIVDNNLIDIADEFLNNLEEYRSGVKYIDKVERFIDRDYLRFKDQNKFIADVENQLEDDENYVLVEEIKELIREYRLIENRGVIDNYDILNEKYTNIRQKFNELFQIYFEKLQDKSEELLKVSKDKKDEIEQMSIQANQSFYNKLNQFINTNENLVNQQFRLSETEAKEKSTNSTLKEVKQAIKLRDHDIEEVKDFVPEPETVKPPTGGGDGPDEEKTYELKIKRQTKNVGYVKDKLDEVLEDLNNEDYDEIKIKLI
ncbi:MAG: BREX system P-loop protein BrxC [Halanaerobiales bacterium]|nr:BREX system P-loop protein BrxC [Halanaerobiales bacterium]